MRFIKRAQQIGFSLAEIRELLSLRTYGGRSADVRSLALTKMAAIEEKMRTLGAMKDILQHLAEECPGCGPASDCPILESLDSTEALV